jgi:hypothetical protein
MGTSIQINKILIDRIKYLLISKETREDINCKIKNINTIIENCII